MKGKIESKRMHGDKYSFMSFQKTITGYVALNMYLFEDFFSYRALDNNKLNGSAPSDIGLSNSFNATARLLL